MRIAAGWVATLALLLAGCLNPRPEELPSSQSLDGNGDPALGEDNGPSAPEPDSPAAPVTPSPPASEPSDDRDPTNGSESAGGADGGTDPAPDAAAPDAGD